MELFLTRSDVSCLPLEAQGERVLRLLSHWSKGAGADKVAEPIFEDFRTNEVEALMTAQPVSGSA